MTSLDELAAKSAVAGMRANPRVRSVLEVDHRVSSVRAHEAVVKLAPGPPRSSAPALSRDVDGSDG